MPGRWSVVGDTVVGGLWSVAGGWAVVLYYAPFIEGPTLLGRTSCPLQLAFFQIVLSALGLILSFCPFFVTILLFIRSRAIKTKFLVHSRVLKIKCLVDFR